MTENSTTSLPQPAPEPGPAPRAVTPDVRRRMWTEPSVRLWWLLSLVLAGVIGYFCVDVLMSRRVETKLIRDGVAVVGRVASANGQSLPGMAQPSDSMVSMEFDWNGKSISESGYLQDRQGYVTIGEKIPMRVDPQDPSVWTNRVQPAPLFHALFPGLIFLPGLPVLLGGAWLVRRKLEKLWVTGEATMGVVHSVRQSPIAPRSYALRCTYRDRRGKLLFTVFVPKNRIAAHNGSTLWLIAPPVDSTSRPVAWAWLE